MTSTSDRNAATWVESFEDRGETRKARSDDVVEKEQMKLLEGKPIDEINKGYWSGIALSGGGIRSSTFCTGILQALAGKGWLQRMDYISTVSGGGFIGSSLQWWWHGDHRVSELTFGSGSDNFPYGTSDPRDPNFKGDKRPQRDNLRYLRTHGYYLTPGNGITFWSGTGVVVRTVLLNLLVWIPIAIALFYLLWQVPANAPVLNSLLLTLPNDGSPLPESLINARWEIKTKNGKSFIVDKKEHPAPIIPEPQTESESDSKTAPPKGVLFNFFQIESGTLKNVFALPPAFAFLIWLGYLLLFVYFIGSCAYAVQTTSSRLWKWNKIPKLLQFLAAIALMTVAWLAFTYKGMGFGWGAAGSLFVGFLGFSVLTRLIIIWLKNSWFKLVKPWLFKLVNWRTDDTLQNDDREQLHDTYFLRRIFELIVSVCFKPMLVLLIIGAVPVAFTFAFFASAGSPGLAGFVSVGAGVAAALAGHAQSIRGIMPGLVAKIVVPVGAGLFLFGVGVLGYHLAMLWIEINISGATGSTGTQTLNKQGDAAGLLTTKDFVVTFFAEASQAVGNYIPLIVTLLIIFGVFMAFAINTNYISLNRFYRDRLMEAYMPNARAVRSGEVGATTADRFGLERVWASREANIGRALGEKGQRTSYSFPYPLINTNCVLVNDDEQRTRLRGGANFLLSPLYCGSESTDWVPTTPDFKHIMVPTAMATSGAAANPNAGYVGTGVTMGRLLSIVMMLLNVRLGYWIVNPSPWKWSGLKWLTSKIRRPSHIFPGLIYSITSFGFKSRSTFLELSDGGHFDNTGMYELIRRRCRLIIACDGEADPNYRFPGFNSLQIRIAEDFGASIEFDAEYLPQSVIPGKKLGYPAGSLYADRPFFIGKIKYRSEKKRGEDAENSEGEESEPKEKNEGILIYIKSTMIRQLSFTTRGYKAQHPSFPHESTADQFFNTEQFDVYQELGYQAALSMMEAIEANEDLRDLAFPHTPSDAAGPAAAESVLEDQDFSALSGAKDPGDEPLQIR